MAASIPELNLAIAERLLGAYCKERIPPEVADKVKLLWRTRGTAITLFESQPGFMDKTQWVEVPVANFRFEDSLWHLYCADRNGKWHAYTKTEGTRDFAALIAAVEEDATGIFWG